MPYRELEAGHFLLTNRFGPQIEQKIVELQDGRLLAVWTGFFAGGDGNGTGVYAQFLTRDGARIGATFRVNDSTVGAQEFPDVAVLEDGRFVIVWNDRQDDDPANLTDVKAKLYNCDGTAVGSEFRVNMETAGDQSSAQVTALPQGGFAVTWTHGAINDQHNMLTHLEVRSRLYDANGVPLGDQYRVNDPANYEAAVQSVHTLANGNMLHVFVQYENSLLSGPLTPRAIYAEIEDSSGAEVRQSFVLVPSQNNRDQVIPWVTALAGGGFAVAFQQMLFEPVTGQGYMQLWMQTFDNDGHAIGSPNPVDRINVASNNPSYFSGDIAALDTGGFVIVSTTGQQFSTLANVRVFNDSGAQIEQFSHDLNSAPGDLSVDAVSGGRFIINWTAGSLPNGVIFAPDLPFLFSSNGDHVDFDTLNPAAYGGAHDDAGDGDDVVVLPHDGGGLIAWGLFGGLFHGGDGNDTITGSSAAGSFVNPILFGDDGSDHLYGGTGDDEIEGGAGDDHLYQAQSPADDHVSDRLVGDAGQDTFHVGAGDIVADLEIGERIVLEGDLATGTIAGVFDEGSDAQGHHYSVQIAVEIADGVQTVSGAEFISATALNFRLETGGGARTLVAVQPAAPALPDDWAANLEQDAEAMIPAKLAQLREMVFDAAKGEVNQKGHDYLTALAFAKLNNTAAMGLSVNDVFRLITYEFDALERAAIGFGPITTIAPKLFVGATFIQAFVGMVAAQIRYQAGITTQAQERVEFAHAVEPLGFGVIEGFKLAIVSGELLTLIGARYAAGFAQFITSLVDDYASAITDPSPTGDFRGTPVRDVLIGTNGDDRFTSSAGSDFYVGNGGNDTIDYSNAAAGVAGDFSSGTVRGAAPGALSEAQATAESFTDIVSGIANIIGSHFGDSLAGDAGANRLQGGEGNDIYVVDSLDTVVEASGQGMDTVYATQSFALGAGAEVEILSVNDTAATVAINLTGNEFGQSLFGNAGANFLVAGGGADGLYGGLGDDTYSVDTLDVVIDSGGFDIIYSSTNYQLNAGSQIEILSANDFTLTTALNLAGNEFGQSIFGNAGDNFLIAGAGADGLYGGLGNDTYSVDTLDIVVDTGGFDTIYSSSNFQLNTGAQIEILSANDYAATTPLNLAGNELGQSIFGNAGNNFLIAGAGADGLYGKGGNDTYSIDSLDVVVENAGEGYDTIYTSTSFTLSAGTEIEVISVSDYAATSAINLTGNEFAQQILGNAGANALNGGAGADSLGGGAGADTFAFTTALGGGNIDTIVDFASGTDKIALDRSIFAALGVGALSAGAFVVGSAAADAGDRIIYNNATGALLYDSDGTGAAAAVQFATLGTDLALAASDFVVI